MHPFHNWMVYVVPMVHIEQARFLYKARSINNYPLMVHTERNVPALYNNPGLGRVVYGEVWEVSNEGVEALDIIEGIEGGFYSAGTMQVVQVEEQNRDEYVDMRGGIVDDCYVYFKGARAGPLSLNHPLSSSILTISGKGSQESLCGEELEILHWIRSKTSSEVKDDIDNVFLSKFTADLHEDYTINKLFPKALALSTAVSLEQVHALIERKTRTGDFDNKSKRELSGIYSLLWKELLGAC